MNISTAKNKAMAMNRVHTMLISIQPELIELFKLDDQSIYKNDSTLCKKIADQINVILKSHNKNDLRVYFVDKYNSVSIEITGMYQVTNNCNEYSSTSYFKANLYLVGIYDGGLQKWNRPIPFDPINYPVNWTSTKLINMQRKANKIQDKIDVLRREMSGLNYWVKG